MCNSDDALKSKDLVLLIGSRLIHLSKRIRRLTGTDSHSVARIEALVAQVDVIVRKLTGVAHSIPNAPQAASANIDHSTPLSGENRSEGARKSLQNAFSSHNNTQIGLSNNVQAGAFGSNAELLNLYDNNGEQPSHFDLVNSNASTNSRNRAESDPYYLGFRRPLNNEWAYNINEALAMETSQAPILNSNASPFMPSLPSHRNSFNYNQNMNRQQTNFAAPIAQPVRLQHQKFSRPTNIEAELQNNVFPCAITGGRRMISETSQPMPISISYVPQNNNQQRQVWQHRFGE